MPPRSRSLSGRLLSRLSALSGIDIALWDIKGKHLNCPIHMLLGGQVRDRLRMYGWVAGEETGDYIEHFKTSVAEDKFTCYKMCPVPAVGVRLSFTEAVRDHLSVPAAHLRPPQPRFRAL